MSLFPFVAVLGSVLTYAFLGHALSHWFSAFGVVTVAFVLVLEQHVPRFTDVRIGWTVLASFALAFGCHVAAAMHLLTVSLAIGTAVLFVGGFRRSSRETA